MDKFERPSGLSSLRDGAVPSPPKASIPDAGRFYRTCKNCAFDHRACARRKQVERGVKGLGLTGLTFLCEQRKPFFRNGQRVEVHWTFALPDADFWDGMNTETWPATVVAETKRGFRIVVDDVESDLETPAREFIKNDSLYCNVSASRLSALDEPDRLICKACDSAENGDGTVTGCWGGEGYHAPNDCLAQAIEARRAETAKTGSVHESAVSAGDAP